MKGIGGKESKREKLQIDMLKVKYIYIKRDMLHCTQSNTQTPLHNNAIQTDNLAPKLIENGE